MALKRPLRRSNIIVFVVGCSHSMQYNSCTIVQLPFRSPGLDAVMGKATRMTPSHQEAHSYVRAGVNWPPLPSICLHRQVIRNNSPPKRQPFPRICLLRLQSVCSLEDVMNKKNKACPTAWTYMQYWKQWERISFSLKKEERHYFRSRIVMVPVTRADHPRAKSKSPNANA
jgi:hypothetical protein